MALNGLKCIFNTPFFFFFFLNVENARVRTPPKCGIFHIFFFDGFPNVTPKGSFKLLLKFYFCTLCHENAKVKSSHLLRVHSLLLGF